AGGSWGGGRDCWGGGGGGVGWEAGAGVGGGSTRAETGRAGRRGRRRRGRGRGARSACGWASDWPTATDDTLPDSPGRAPAVRKLPAAARFRLTSRGRPLINNKTDWSVPY